MHVGVLIEHVGPMSVHIVTGRSSDLIFTCINLNKNITCLMSHPVPVSYIFIDKIYIHTARPIPGYRDQEIMEASRRIEGKI